ncbi:protein of unknown function [Kyrpidia spormannii]|uniref:Uncharacterized protein n=1 Tax=Kyrpidia spormannii TaxID=2055160 RepID=A0A6F9EHT7_9BACL|nr:protein of unknown function [Kyrpidia spormannii]
MNPVRHSVPEGPGGRKAGKIAGISVFWPIYNIFVALLIFAGFRRERRESTFIKSYGFGRSFIQNSEIPTRNRSGVGGRVSRRSVGEGRENRCPGNDWEIC